MSVCQRVQPLHRVLREESPKRSQVNKIRIYKRSLFLRFYNIFLGATFKFKDSIRERFGKEFEQDRTSSMETPQRRSVESYGLTTTSNPTMLESGSSRKRAGRSSSEHFEDTKNSLHYHNHPSSKDYKLNHSHHHPQQLQTHEYKTEKKVIFLKLRILENFKFYIFSERTNFRITSQRKSLHPIRSIRRSCQTLFASLRTRIGLALDAPPCYHLSQFLWTCQNGLKTVLMASKTYK